MKILGIEFDDPRDGGVSKRDFSERKEGRTTVREMWVCGYSTEGSAICMSRYCVTLNNRGVCTFDGRQVRDENEKKLIAELFEGVKVF